MMAAYWWKAYVCILDDAKLMDFSLADIGGMFLLFNMAAEIGEDGLLPKMPEICWRLRRSTDDLEPVINKLMDRHILAPHDKGYLVVNWSKRQAPISDTVRSREYRKRKQVETYQSRDNHDNETNRDVDKIREDTDKTRIDIEADDIDRWGVVVDDKGNVMMGNLHAYFEQHIGILTPRIAEMIEGWLNDYPPGWVKQAIDVAVEQNVRKPAYVDAVLSNWSTEGKGGKKTNYKKLKQDPDSKQSREKYGEWNQ